MGEQLVLPCICGHSFNRHVDGHRACVMVHCGCTKFNRTTPALATKASKAEHDIYLEIVNDLNIAEGAIARIKKAIGRG